MDMRGLHAYRSPLMPQGSSDPPHLQTSSFSLPCWRVPATSAKEKTEGLKGEASAEEGGACSGRTPSTTPAAAVAAVAASASSRRGSDRDADACEWCGDTRETAAAAAGLTVRRRRLRKSGAADRASSEEGRHLSTPFSRVLRLLRITGDPYEVEDDEKALPENMSESLRHHSAADALLSWWGGEGASAETQGDDGEGKSKGRGFRAGLLALFQARRLPLAVLMFGGPAALSVLLLSFTLPMSVSETPRFKAPVHYSMLVHADVFLRLLLASIKCIYVTWIFGSGQQIKRVGLLPLLLLSCCLLPAAAIPLSRALLPADRTDMGIASLLLLSLLFAALAAVAVVFSTASKLRYILSKGKGPERPRRRASESRGHHQRELRRSGARSLSLSLRCTYSSRVQQQDASIAGASSFDGCSPRGSRLIRMHTRRGPLQQHQGPLTGSREGREISGRQRTKRGGFFLPDTLEPLLPQHTVQLPRCWVPRASFTCRLSLLDDVNPRLFNSSGSTFSRRPSRASRSGDTQQQHRGS
ncbi:hypothetical protein Emag_007135 [Eimeria magna]